MERLGPRLEYDSAVPPGAPVVGADIQPTRIHVKGAGFPGSSPARFLSDLSRRSGDSSDENVIDYADELIVVRAGPLAANTQRILVRYGQ
jgi:hypothetical protein